MNRRIKLATAVLFGGSLVVGGLAAAPALAATSTCSSYFETRSDDDNRGRVNCSAISNGYKVRARMALWPSGAVYGNYVTRPGYNSYTEWKQYGQNNVSAQTVPA